MKVLITGITGFLGSHLLDKLLKTKNYELVGMTRNSAKASMLEKQGIEIRKADLLRLDSLTDPNNDAVYYWIEWDDGSPAAGWLGPYASNQALTVNHTYTKKGTYVIRCQAKDTLNATSDWGTLKIKMPLSYTVFLIHFWERLFERFPHLFLIPRYLFQY